MRVVRVICSGRARRSHRLNSSPLFLFSEEFTPSSVFRLLITINRSHSHSVSIFALIVVHCLKIQMLLNSYTLCSRHDDHPKKKVRRRISSHSRFFFSFWNLFECINNNAYFLTWQLKSRLLAGWLLLQHRMKCNWKCRWRSFIWFSTPTLEHKCLFVFVASSWRSLALLLSTLKQKKNKIK